MPIRKSISAAGRRVARQSALKLFTDRNHERELLRQEVTRLRKGNVKEEAGRPSGVCRLEQLAGSIA